MRDLAMLGAMLAFVPLALRSSFAAYGLWAWTGIVSPVFYLYGFMQGVRYNLIFALIALVGLVLRRERRDVTMTTTQGLLLAFALSCTLSATFSYQPNPSNWPYYQNAMKSLAFCIFMPFFISGRLRIQALVMVIAVGLGFHAVVEGLKVLATGGGHRVLGMPSTLMSDNNQFAVGMVMAVPLCYLLYNSLLHKFARLGALAAMGLAALTVIGTNSRGGFLALAVVGLWLGLTSRRKVLTLVLVAAMGVALFLWAPASWFDRMQTIQTAGEQDSSFLGRVIAWKISTAIALSNPIFGGGIHAVQSFVVWDHFKNTIGFLDFISTPPPGEIPRAAHSIYFEILGDLGFVGFGIFVALIVTAFRTAGQIRKLVANNTHLNWARDIADMLKVAVAAYAVGGAGVSMGYFEEFFAMAALLEIIKQHVLAEQKKAVAKAVAAPDLPLDHSSTGRGHDKPGTVGRSS